MKRKMVMLLTACILMNASVGTVATRAAEQNATETEQTEETGKDENGTSEEDPLAAIEKLETEISRQPVRVTEVNITTADSGLVDFPSYVSDDVLLPVIYNESGNDVKDIQVYVMSWDENNLPVKIHSNYMKYGNESYVSIMMGGVNLINGAYVNAEDGDTFYTVMADQVCNVKKSKALVVAYSTFDGEVWTNPLINDWIAAYGGKKLVEPVVYTDKETVQKVQEGLNGAGFDCGTPDGVAGAKTYEALHGYQKANDLAITDDITDSLLNKMGIGK
nr:DUF5780 domain-containing protein [uncultured Blautia sp.]